MRAAPPFTPPSPLVEAAAAEVNSLLKHARTLNSLLILLRTAIETRTHLDALAVQLQHERGPGHEVDAAQRQALLERERPVVRHSSQAARREQ